jgi:hypothetical protein
MTIAIVLGRNGAGKTHAAVQEFVVPTWRVGRAVWSNTPLFPEEAGLARELYRPLDDPLGQLPRLGRHVKRVCVACGVRARKAPCRACGSLNVVDVPRRHPDGSLWSLTENVGVGVLFDECTAMFPSRGTLSVPPQMQRLLKQWRKPDIGPVVITDTSWARIDLLIRETALVVVESHPAFERWLSRRPETPWGWPQHRAFVRVSYDGASYERADATGRWDMCPALSTRTRWQWWRNQRVFDLYDTTAGVEVADHVECPECFGTLKMKPCPDPHGHREFAREQRGERERQAYPLPASLLDELGAVDDEDEREAELLGVAS